MRRHRWAAALTTALSVAGVPSAAAHPLDFGRPALGPPAVSVDSSRIAFAARPGVLSVVVPGRPDRALSVPSCGPGEPLLPSASRREVLVCRSTLVDLITGGQRTTSVGTLQPSYPGDIDSFDPRLLGTRWLSGDMQVAGAIGSNVSFPVVVERATGRVVRVSRWPDTRYLDLDAARPDQPLCPPVRQTATFDGYGRFGDLVKVGAWTLRSAPTPMASYRPVLQRCGSRRTTSFAPRTVAALGRGHVAWLANHAVHLRTLATGHTRVLPLARTGRLTLAFSSNRLVISQQPGYAGPWRIFTIPIG